MKLSEMQVRNAKPLEKPYKLADGESMYLLVKPNGGRYWRLDFTFKGLRKSAALGIYPAVGLKDARLKRDEAKAKLAHGENPIVATVSVQTFHGIAEEWFDLQTRSGTAPNTMARSRWLLEFTKPISKMDITTITTPDMLAMLRRVEGQGKLESARRLRSMCARIFRYAIATARAERNVCADLTGVLIPPRVTHRSAPLTPEAAGKLMRAISAYEGNLATGLAMRLGALTFVRPFELRFAVWSEFDLAGAIWRIPAARMKMKRDHIIPLSRQSLEVLRKLAEFYQATGLLFQSQRSADRPISENTINVALRSMGFAKAEVSHHGFRRMASTMLNEHGFNRDWIERQLAHVEPNAVRYAYNAAEYLEGRVAMMQSWADLLDRFADDEDLIG